MVVMVVVMVVVFFIWVELAVLVVNWVLLGMSV